MPNVIFPFTASPRNTYKSSTEYIPNSDDGTTINCFDSCSGCSKFKRTKITEPVMIFFEDAIEHYFASKLHLIHIQNLKQQKSQNRPRYNYIETLYPFILKCDRTLCKSTAF